MCIKIGLKEKGSVARDFSDYAVTVDEADMPNGVELQTKIG